MRLEHSIFFALVMPLALGFAACSSKLGAPTAESHRTISRDNVVTSDDSNIKTQIGDSQVTFGVLGRSALRQNLMDGSIKSATSPEGSKFLSQLATAKKASAALAASVEPASPPAAEPTASVTQAPDESLQVGIPAALLGEQNVFGGVITKVSDLENESLGGLKLTDLPPIHGKLLLAGDDTTGYSLLYVGCAGDCSEASEQQALVQIPVVGIDQANGQIIVDLASLGDQLDLISILDPDGEGTGLKARSAKTIFADYSVSTLVFDVESAMIPKDAVDPQDPALPITKFTTRWYFKLSSAFNPGFTARSAANGVGFFETGRAADPKITRFSLTDFGTGAPIQYFMKNVPDDVKPAFSAVFDAWNTELTAIVGRPLLSYEFVDQGDERADLLQPGDIRYNIVEWDLNNKASYGGLGPSVANQYTGETFSANVLVQGPTIVTLYRDWFHASEAAQQLVASGQPEAAEKVLADARLKFNAKVSRTASSRPRMSMTLGKKLSFRINSQLTALEDPVAPRNDFYPIPEGQTYESYMPGYWLDLLGHEMGHNLGLRHNFRGNMGADGSADHPLQSRSIMEYLGRAFRFKDGIGEYDRMAISYGYKGIAPTHLDWFCTDEDGTSQESPTNSAECSSNDATKDPYSYLNSLLDLAIGYLTAPDSTTAPTWSVPQMSGPLGIALNGIAAYASSAEATSATWTNWKLDSTRPVDAPAISAYVISGLKAKLCNSTLDQAIKVKADDAGKQVVRDNLVALRAQAEDAATKFGIGSLACN